MNDKSLVMSLEKCASELKTAILSSWAGTLRSMEITVGVRETFFPDDWGSWLAWMGKNGVRQRHAERLLKTGRFLREIEKVSAACSTNLFDGSVSLDKLEMLADIPIERLPAFLSKYDVAELDRAAVRAAWNDFLGKEPKKDAQGTFWDSGRLPDPAKLTLLPEDPKWLARIDREKELALSHITLQRALMATPKLDAATAERMMGTYRQLIDGEYAERKRREPKKGDGR